MRSTAAATSALLVALLHVVLVLNIYVIYYLPRVPSEGSHGQRALDRCNSMAAEVLRRHCLEIVVATTRDCVHALPANVVVGWIRALAERRNRRLGECIAVHAPETLPPRLPFCSKLGSDAHPP